MFDYPALLKAFQLIALDNNGINRNRSAEQQNGEAIQFIIEEEQVKRFDLAAIEEWLKARTDEELDTICTGEESEMEHELFNAPFGTNDLLNHYFNTIC